MILSLVDDNSLPLLCIHTIVSTCIKTSQRLTRRTIDRPNPPVLNRTQLHALDSEHHRCMYPIPPLLLPLLYVTEII